MTNLFDVHFEPQDLFVISKLLVQLIDLWRDGLALRTPRGEAVNDENIRSVFGLVKCGSKFSPVLDLSVTHLMIVVDSLALKSMPEVWEDAASTAMSEERGWRRSVTSDRWLQVAMQPYRT